MELNLEEGRGAINGISRGSTAEVRVAAEVPLRKLIT
jgi:hypothetical protein